MIYESPIGESTGTRYNKYQNLTRKRIVSIKICNTATAHRYNTEICKYMYVKFSILRYPCVFLFCLFIHNTQLFCICIVMIL